MQDVSHSGQPGPATSERPWQTAAIVHRQDAHASARGAYVSDVMDAVLYLDEAAFVTREILHVDGDKLQATTRWWGA